MVVDTVWGLTLKKNDLLTTLQNNSDLSPEEVESYLIQIEMYDAEIDSIKDL